MSNDRTTGAAATLRRFVEANARRDDDAMKACLSRATLEAGGFSGSTPPGVEFRMGTPEDGEDGAVIIPLEVISTEAPEGSPPLDTMRCVMVEEDGEWKFDLLTTISPMVQAAEQMMQEAMGQLGEAMQGAFEAVGEAMSSAFGEADGELTSVFTGEPLTLSTWEEAPDAPTSEELVKLPEYTTLPGLSQSASEVMGRPVPVVVDVAGILGLFGAEDAGPLMPWLENDFPQGLVAALDVAARAVPAAAARVRRVRIEAAYDWMDRSVFLDGPDLVYRADMRDPNGWYSGDELAQIVLGVVAGLQDGCDAITEGFGEQPRGEPLPSIDVLREVRIPREMKRLSRALGNGVGTPVAVDMDWTSLWPSDQLIRNWCVWGIGRVIGAVRLLYPEGQESVPEGLVRIVRMNLGQADREASLEEGVLSIAIVPSMGERGCFYEHELSRVLMGERLGLTGDAGEAGEAGEGADEEGQEPEVEFGSDDGTDRA